MWLTPDSAPDEFTCITIRVKNSPTYREAVAGALLELSYSRNWEQRGALTVYEVADDFLDAFLGITWGCAVQPGDIILSARPADNLQTLECKGQPYDKEAFPHLFNAIGYTFGGSGSAPLLPDLRYKTPIGTGAKAPGESSVSLGEVVGQEKVTLSSSEMPMHSHTVHQHAEFLVVAPGEAPVALMPIPSLGSTSVEGGNQAHNNMQPSIGLNFLIITGR